jgi:hypothetical protein
MEVLEYYKVLVVVMFKDKRVMLVILLKKSLCNLDFTPSLHQVIFCIYNPLFFPWEKSVGGYFYAATEKSSAFTQ